MSQTIGDNWTWEKTMLEKARTASVGSMGSLVGRVTFSAEGDDDTMGTSGLGEGGASNFDTTPSEKEKMFQAMQRYTLKSTSGDARNVNNSSNKTVTSSQDEHVTTTFAEVHSPPNDLL